MTTKTAAANTAAATVTQENSDARKIAASFVLA